MIHFLRAGSILGFALLVLSNSASAYYPTAADDCSTVDLRAGFPMKVRDQGNVSWCYAHTSADYLQFYFQIPVQISAADIAIQYNLRAWPRLLRFFSHRLVPETGLIRSAMWDAYSSGYCAESDFPSDFWVKRDSKGTETKKMLGDAFQELFDLQASIHQGVFLSDRELPFLYAFKHISPERFYEIISRTNQATLLNEIRKAACDGHRMPYTGKSFTGLGWHLKGPNTFVNINAFLNHAAPVTVDFFYDVLRNIDQYSHKLSQLHTTLLMGRRFNPATQECQYLIKNTFGEDCSDYDPRNSCDHGYAWLNESSLYSAMITYVYINDLVPGSEDYPNVTGVESKNSSEQTQDDEDDQSSEDDLQ